eukprot:m.78203 g.78203  ORF g.78203 m.78203 type:complete len:406 (+) comp14575_c0_seq2:1219-2436(+)
MAALTFTAAVAVCGTLLLMSLALSSATPVPDDTHRDVAESIRHAGYPVEEHQAVTSDGFVLFAQRIPPRADVTPRGPVYVMPGLTCTTSVYVAKGAPDGLPYVLSDAGFDVWLINQRCRPYPTHIKYNATQPEMWQWTVDQIALQDVTAGLDLIKNYTGQQTVEAFVGHSQGGLIGWASFSRYEHLAARVKLFVSLAGPAYPPPARPGPAAAEAPAPLGSLACPVHKGWPGACDGLVGLHEGAAINWEGCAALGKGCSELACLVCGCQGVNHVNDSRLVVMFGHYPSLSSELNMEHWEQLAKDGFQLFDYGPAGNKAHYNSSTPPIYNISNLHTRSAIFYGSNDKFVEESLVEAALKIAPEDKLEYVGKLPYGHLDFLLNNNVRTDVYDEIVRLLLAPNGTTTTP